ncbi:nitrate- and nitrite sensing domain-containing protein [Streptoverticillium reticulum]|uniref:nitrate- and nitrite sensing domain-containing protein n=1 Tax=Streptoverticillium reticulum TaxID=1433415 RepID=UPI0039BF4CB6
MQGRFKRDGSAAAEPEPRGATDRGTPPDAPNATPDGAEAAEQPQAKEPSGTGSRIALRNWRISTRLVSLLALPVVAATTLGALRIDTSLQKVDQLDHMKLLTEMTGKATQLADALQQERDQSAGPIISGNPKDDKVLASRQKADRAIDAFRQTTAKVKPNDPTMVGVTTTLVDISKQLDKIKEIRQSAYTDKDFLSQSVNNYDGLINSLLTLSQDMAQATSDSDMITATRALATFSAAKEYASIQRAVISAALARPGGAALSANDRQYGKSALDAEDEAMRRFTAIDANNSASLLKALNGGIPDITSANTFAERVLGKADGLKSEPKSYLDWYDQDSVKLEEMAKIETTLLTEMDQKAADLKDEANQEAILNGALIVLVLGISLVGAFVVARSMVRSLRRLQDTATRVAQDRLPELVKQLSETDPQDVDTSVESVGVHSRDEIGKVAAAFDHVHQEAVRLAAEQALLRGNVNAMFTNLSRRSQGLIQRQLSLISELESREADPDQLSSLFKLDHLATRMRRNGENLLVLAGEEPGRRWTRPVPLVDVLRAAASEVEQYERIELSGVPPTEVAGRVVNDLVHLLAELLENATSFSSPQTKVKVTGHALPDGRVLVEIHDTGIGLSPEDLASINERLASPPTVDVSVSRRMGLFVVGRLSLRHGIRIQLRPSDSGGTTALVMLPVDVAQGHKKPAPGAQGGPGGKGGLPAGPAGGPGQRREVPGSGPRPALGGGRGATPGGLPTRGGAGLGPSGGAAAGSLFDTSPRGGAGRKGGAVPPPAGAAGKAPQLPARGQAPSWGNGTGPGAGQPSGGRKAPVDDWPMSSDSAPRGAQETPRGHEDVEGTGQFAQPAPGGAKLSGGPGDTAQFAPITDDTPAPAGTSGGTGQFAVPGGPSDTGQNQLPGGTGQFALPGDPSDTGQNHLPGGTGQFPVPGNPSDTGQNRLPGGTGQFTVPGNPSDTGQNQLPGGTGQFALPGNPSDTGQNHLPGGTGQFAMPGDASDTGQNQLPGGTGQFALPGNPSDTGQNHLPGGTGQFPVPGNPSDTGQNRLPGSTGQFALPGDPSDTGQNHLPGDTGQFALPHSGERPNSTTGQFTQPGTAGDPLGSNTGQFAAPAGSGDTGQNRLPAAGDPAGDALGGADRFAPPAGSEPSPLFDELESHWFRGAAGGVESGDDAQPRRAAAPAPAPSANDERWRRAEQVREPAAGGITSSGLPRRVPRANLVDGTAEQAQSLPTGPAVSRAPDDVRGRLTNLRRGIQQGRQAGNGSTTGSHNVGPTYQQER